MSTNRSSEGSGRPVGGHSGLPKRKDGWKADLLAVRSILGIVPAADRGRRCEVVARNSGPNGLKLSDRHRRGQAWSMGKGCPLVPVRWSAWLGRPPTEGLWTAGTEDGDSGGGMTGAAAENGGTEEPACRKEGRANGTARAGTDGCWLELGTGVPPATGTWTDSPPEPSPGKACWPNELKLSDRGWPRKAPNAGKTHPPASVRWSAWLGPRLQSGRTWTDGDSGGGNDGRCRRERTNGGTDKDRRAGRGTGTRSPSKTPTRETQGLTNSSSATGHGDARGGRTKRSNRHGLFAGAHG